MGFALGMALLLVMTFAAGGVVGANLFSVHDREVAQLHEDLAVAWIRGRIYRDHIPMDWRQKAEIAAEKEAARCGYHTVVNQGIDLDRVISLN